MKKIINISCVLFLFVFEVFSQNKIKIDGFFNDWNSNLNTYIDDSTDSQAVELLDFSICNDDDYLLFSKMEIN